MWHVLSLLFTILTGLALVYESGAPEQLAAMAMVCALAATDGLPWGVIKDIFLRLKRATEAFSTDPPDSENLDDQDDGGAAR